MQAAIVKAIVRVVFHGIRAAPGERRNGRMIQVEQVLLHREFIGIPLPKWEFLDRTFYKIVTHSLYNTLIMAIGGADETCVRHHFDRRVSRERRVCR